jgi:hypothetical protein
MAKGDSYAASQLFMGLTPKNGYKASKLYCYKPTDGSGDFTWARNINSYRLNQSGLLELMGNNMPRIDYTNTCPELLIEGERTNLALRSNHFGNATWSKTNVTVTDNIGVAPDGNTTADRLQGTGTSSIDQTITTIADTYTASVWVKSFSGSNQTFRIKFNGGFSGDLTATSEWQRFTYTTTSTAASNTWGIASDSSNNNYDILAFEYQVELSSYVTSNIPTTTASVTRPQDTNSSDIAFTGDGFSYNLRVRLENRSDSGTPDNIFFIEDIAGLGDTYIGCYVLGDNLVFTFYNNPELHEFSISLPDGIHNIGVSFDCTNGAYEIVIDGVSEFSGTIPDGYLGANIYESVKLGCLGASTDSIGLNRIIGLQVYDAVLTQGELIEYTS